MSPTPVSTPITGTDLFHCSKVRICFVWWNRYIMIYLHLTVFNTFHLLPSGTLEVLNVQITIHRHTPLRDVLTGL